MTTPVISSLGDTAITFRFGREISDELSRAVVAHARQVSAAGIIGVSEVVPAYASLTVFYDPAIIRYDDVCQRALAVIWDPIDTAEETGQGKTHRLPVVYDGEDLPEVAQRTGLSVDDVIQIHSSAEYRVFVTGFVPGFAYLGILDEQLALPRRESPRKRVPPGSVAIADRQTGIYPAATPGGWHILGTTSSKMFDPAREQPALLQVGDTVKFEPIG